MDLINTCYVTQGWGCDPSFTKSYKGKEGKGAPMIDITYIGYLLGGFLQ